MVTWLDDHLNPIVVRELRQAVRARFVAVLLLVYLAVQLLVLGLFLVDIDPSRPTSGSLSAGRNAFFVLFFILQMACMVFTPAYLAARLAGERAGSELDLMFATSLSPAAIVRGKLLSGAVIALLFYSVATPFMTFTYLLRGIDMPTIVLVLAMGFASVIPALALAVLLACLPVSRPARVILYLGSGIMVLWFQAFISAILPAQIAMGGVGGRAGQWGFWHTAATITVTDLAAVAILYSVACAALASPATNRAPLVRLTISGGWMATGAVSILWALHSGDSDALMPWLYFSAICFAGTMFAAVSERDLPGPRVAAAIPRRRWLRVPAFLLYSGSAGGLAWSVLMINLTLVAVATTVEIMGGSLLTAIDDELTIAAGIGVHGLCYATAAAWVQRRLLAHRVRQTHTWVIATFLVAIGAILPVTLELLIYGGTSPNLDLELWQITSPFALGDDAVRAAVLLGGTLVLIPAAILGRRWWWQQIRAFRPPEDASG
jgi:hypothetical protein